MRPSALLMIPFVLLVPRLAHAEVMDKVPTLALTWTFAVVGGGIGGLAWRFAWWLAAIAAVWQPRGGAIEAWQAE
jgi:hypothetical protein